MTPTAHFTDGSTSPVTDVRWSPEFITGLAHRGDGKCRCVFFDRNGLHRDPWIARLEPAPKQIRGVG